MKLCICRPNQAIPILLFASLVNMNVAPANANPSNFHSQIENLQKLGESQPNQALPQLNDLNQHPPAAALETDLRDLLLVLIPLNFYQGNKSQANLLIEALEKHGDRSDDPVSRAMVLNYKAKLARDEGRLSEALIDIEKALPIAQSINDRLIHIQIKNTAGEIYSLVGEFKKGLELISGALAELDSRRDNAWQSESIRIDSLFAIGRLYLAHKQAQVALDYFLKAENLAAQSGSLLKVAAIANYRGIAYADLDQWNQAKTAYLESLNIGKQFGLLRIQSANLNDLADAALNQSNYAECEKFALESIRVGEADHENDVLAVAYNTIGICHMSMGQLVKGEAEAKKGIEIARASNVLPILEATLGDLSEAYEKSGQYRKSLSALREKDQVAAKMFQHERELSITEMKLHYENDLKQQEINRLEHQNNLQRAEIANRNLQKIIALLTVVLSMFVSGVSYFLYKKVRSSNRKLLHANRDLLFQSTRDPLTGLLNRRAFQSEIKSISQEFLKRSNDVTTPHDVLILLDIDHFKTINDTYGHKAGDFVLVELSQRLQRNLREKDRLMRWGGEEFLIYLHQISIDSIALIVERELNAIGSAPFIENDVTIHATVSMGFVLLPIIGIEEKVFNWEKILHLTDLALYMAKTSGRNQAIGIESFKGTKEHVAQFIDGDLQGAIDHGRVSVRRINGPLQ